MELLMTESHIHLQDIKSSPSLTGQNSNRSMSSIRLNLLTKTTWKLKTPGGLERVGLSTLSLPPEIFPCIRPDSFSMPPCEAIVWCFGQQQQWPAAEAWPQFHLWRMQALGRQSVEGKECHNLHFSPGRTACATHSSRSIWQKTRPWRHGGESAPAVCPEWCWCPGCGSSDGSPSSPKVACGQSLVDCFIYWCLLSVRGAVSLYIIGGNYLCVQIVCCLYCPGYLDDVARPGLHVQLSCLATRSRVTGVSTVTQPGNMTSRTKNTWTFCIVL